MSTPSLAQAITPELRRWIQAQAAAGCTAQDILRGVRASGWDEPVALAAIEHTLQVKVDPAAPPPSVALPGPDLAQAPALLQLPDREVRVLMSLRQPRIVCFAQLLSDAECDGLIELARPRLERSQTVDHASGGSEVNAARTSDGMFFRRNETPLISRIERRIAELLRWPADRGEGLQVLRYRPGAQYRPHFDYFDPAQPGTGAVLKRGGQRVGTLLLYLQAPANGGATVFPDIGLEFAPVKGHALFFSYDRPDPATGTLHGGEPVTQGEKWVATKWLREDVFD